MRTGRGGPDRFLGWKLGIFFLGAGLFMAGAATGRQWAVAAAIGVLALGMVLRFLPGRSRSDGGEPEGE